MKYLAPLLVALLVIGCSPNNELDRATETQRPARTSSEAASVIHPGSDHDQTTAEATLDGDVQVVKITADGRGFSPTAVRLQAGIPVRLVFTRTTDASCLEHVSVPEFGVEKEPLPMHEAVAIEFTPGGAGEYTFVCGMGMQEGMLVVTS